MGSSARGSTQPIPAAHAQSSLASCGARLKCDKGFDKWCKFPVPPV